MRPTESAGSAGGRIAGGQKTRAVAEIDGLIFPGGESTTLIKLMDSWDWWAPLEASPQPNPFLALRRDDFACKSVSNPPQKSLALIDIDVERNGYGRQIDGFEGPDHSAQWPDARVADGLYSRTALSRVGAGVKGGRVPGRCGDGQAGNVWWRRFIRTDGRSGRASVFRRDDRAIVIRFRTSTRRYSKA